VEGADVELVDGQDERIAADDERKRTDLGDPVSDANWKLALKVLGTFLLFGEISCKSGPDIIKNS